MNTTFVYRRAIAEQTATILEIIAHAKAQMKARGSAQWQDGYPAAEDIARDIARGEGWVLLPVEATQSHIEERPQPIAYGAVLFSGEPAYDHIEGKWHTQGAYVVVHRLAVAEREKGHGVAAEFMRRVEQLARKEGVDSLRVDTNFDNEPMLRLLQRQGFTYCGKIHYQSGERVAFDKQL